jgi:protein-disulfide isomerase
MATLIVPVTSNDHIQGNFDAPITLVEYGDYQCPYCAWAYTVVKKLQNHFGEKMRFVFRNFPMTEIHPFAEPAAEAAEFASAHGHFWEMHDLIYENQEDLSIPLLIELAKKLKLPFESLNSIIKNKTYESQIHNDFLGGVRSGVNGTPTFYINNQRYNGQFVFADVINAIESGVVA